MSLATCLRHGALARQRRLNRWQDARLAETNRLRSMPPRYLAVGVDHEVIAAPGPREWAAAVYRLCSEIDRAGRVGVPSRLPDVIDRLTHILIQIPVRRDLVGAARLDLVRKLPGVISANWSDEP